MDFDDEHSIKFSDGLIKQSFVDDLFPVGKRFFDRRKPLQSRISAAPAPAGVSAKQQRRYAHRPKARMHVWRTASAFIWLNIGL